MAVYPVRRQCPRFQATGYTKCRAVHDQGPHGKRVRESEGRSKRSKSSGSGEQGKEDLKRSRTDEESNE